MTVSEEFRRFYEIDLLPNLIELEQVRKRIVIELVLFLILFVAFVSTTAYYGGGFHDFAHEVQNEQKFLIGIIIVIAGAILGFLLYGRIFGNRFAKIRFDFKRSVVAKIVNFVDEGLGYYEDDLISKEEYDASKLFPIEAKEYAGEDHVLGTSGKTSFKFSELHTRYFMKDHRGRKVYTTIFKGLFFIADFNKHFTGETIVLPDTAEKIFGSFGKEFQRLNWMRDQLINLEDPEFEKEFAVYGSDQVEARYILSPKLMQRITEFKRKTGHQIHLSFIDTKVNVAISLNKDLFEPPIFGSMLRFNAIYENYKYLKIATGIVEDLDLNTRIWTRE